MSDRLTLGQTLFVSRVGQCREKPTMESNTKSTKYPIGHQSYFLVLARRADLCPTMENHSIAIQWMKMIKPV